MNIEQVNIPHSTECDAQDVLSVRHVYDLANAANALKIYQPKILTHINYLARLPGTSTQVDSTETFAFFLGAHHIQPGYDRILARFRHRKDTGYQDITWTLYASPVTKGDDSVYLGSNLGDYVYRKSFTSSSDTFSNEIWTFDITPYLVDTRRIINFYLSMTGSDTAPNSAGYIEQGTIMLWGGR